MQNAFQATLKYLMKKTNTTQKQLAEYIDVRPQSISLYCLGETQPNADKILKMAEYFGVTTDYLLTGVPAEDVPVMEMTGLSQRTVDNLKLVKDGYFEDDGKMIALLDRLLGDKDFYLTIQAVCAVSTPTGNADTIDTEEFRLWKRIKLLEDYLLEVL